MQVGVSKGPLRSFKLKFATEARWIQEATQRHNMNPALREEIMDQLALAAIASQEGVDTPGDAAYGRVVSELNLLLSALPARLDSGIADAAAELKLDRLVELMTTVRGTHYPLRPRRATLGLRRSSRASMLCRGCATNSRSG
jgi:hypothetical protein